jgi:hypothetical protein
MRDYWTQGRTQLAARVVSARKELPWCGPPPDDARERPGRAPSPGEVLLLTCVEADRRGSVWRTSRHDTDGVRRVPLIGSAELAFRASTKLAADHLPRTLPAPAVDVLAQAWPVFGTADQVVVDGASVGLALALARASTRLEVPVPASVATSAAIGADNALAPVDGLLLKLAAVYQGCPAVTRVIVAACQLDDARAIEGPWTGDPNFEIVGAGDLTEAFRLVWGDVDALCRARLDADPRAAERELWGRVIGRVSSRWPQVAETASYLSKLDSTDHFRLDVVEKVARRHAGRTDVLLPWVNRSELSHREPWLKVVAHVVQSAADAGDDDALREYLRLAERELRPLGERSPAEIELVGACGRGWAVLREPGRAEAHLREATEAWGLIGDPARASFPLCEWLRVTAAFGLANAADVIERADRALSEVSFDPFSRAYLNLDVARARLLAGRDPERAALHASAAVAAQPGATHPGPTARRWLIRALRDLGRPADADAQLRDLEALHAERPSDPTARTAPLLAALDGIEQSGGDLEGTEALRVLAELRAAWPIEVAHAARGAQGRGEAAAVIRHFRD